MTARPGAVAETAAAVPAPRGARRPRSFVVALAVFAIAAPITMRGWLDGDRLPTGDYPGFAAEAQHFATTLGRWGRLPVWDAERFAGTTPFVSPMKEAIAFPFVATLGVAWGLRLTFVALKLVSALGMYLIFARLLDAPAAGIVAGYAYAFGSSANSQIDPVVVSFALFPLVFVAAGEMLRAPRTGVAAAFGALTAIEFCAHSYVQSIFCPLMVLLLLWLRPWRGAAEGSGVERRLATRTGIAMAVAAAVFVLLAGSQLAWFAVDLRNHDLYAPEAVEEGLRVYVQSNPLSFVLRRQWLAPAGTIDPLVGGGRYLGFAVAMIVVAGWFAGRRVPSLRRWFQAFALLLLTQYWLSTGTVTLWSALGDARQWSAATQALLGRAFSVASFALLAWGIVLLARARRRGGGPSAWAETVLGLALLAFASSHSLFALLRQGTPILAGMRSPGHFFDVASFSSCGLLGVATVSLARAVGGRTPAGLAGRLVVAAVALAVAVDFWPSTRVFYRGTSWRELHELSLPSGADEGGTLRVTTRTVAYLPEADLLVSGTDLGRAWSWLNWQATVGWRDYMDLVTGWMGPRPPGWHPHPGEREVGEALSRIARIKYVIDRQGLATEIEVDGRWTLLGRHLALGLYEQPDVGPMAYGTRGYVLVVGGDAWTSGAVAAAAVPRNALAVSGGARLSDADERLMADALRIVAREDAVRGDDGSRALAERLGEKITTVGADAPADILGTLPEGSTVPVGYARPAPEHIKLTVDAGPAAAVLFASEAWHPWWKAFVDGNPAPLLRVQMAFMGVRVGPGSHVVDLRLVRPLAVATADWVTVASWILLALVTVTGGARRLRPRGNAALP